MTFSIRLPQASGLSLLSLETPKVMGILNVTPDSFYAGSRTPDRLAIRSRIEEMIQQGVDIIDIGGYSTRPGASDVTPDEEFRRLASGIECVRSINPQIPISVDTFRAGVARRCVEDFNVEIINDIGGGELDPEMWQTVAELKRAYILMHSRGTPATMTSLNQYNNVTADVISNLWQKVAELRRLGVADVIIDPGFGFAKDVNQNFSLMQNLKAFQMLDAPLLVGISRKSMIWRTLNVTPEESANGTTVLNTFALMNGANILRVHDVRQAVECIKLTEKLLNGVV